MRSLIFLSAALSATAYSSASTKETDVTVVVTSTRTKTFCPIAPTCDAHSASALPTVDAHGFSALPTVDAHRVSALPTVDPYGPYITATSPESGYTGHWEDWNIGGPKTSSGGGSATGSSSGSDVVSGTKLSTGSGSGSTKTGSATGSGSFTKSGSATGSGPSTKSGSATDGGSSTKTGSATGSGSFTKTDSATGSVSSSTGSATGSGSSSTGSATGGSSSSSKTTESSSSSTTSKSGGSTGLPETECNTPADRKKWCHGKSIDSDTHIPYYSGDTCKFELIISNGTRQFDYGVRPAFFVNDQSPGPAIECNWGDMIEVKVLNLLPDNATSIHWHGIRQIGTNDMDGVPGVSECGIAPGTSKTYTFHASTYGTAWYHSHLLAQYGDGIRGPIIIHGPASSDYDIDMGTVLIEDTFNATIFATAFNVAHSGPGPTINYLLNGKNKRVDLAVGEHQKWTLKPGKKHLFRLINGGAQNTFSVHFDNHVMTVIAADLVPIVPYTTDWINLMNGQRYDVIIEAVQPVKNYFLRAVTQRGCPGGCVNSGLVSANGILQYEGNNGTFPTTNLGNKTAADFATLCAGEPLSKLVPYVAKTAGSQEDFDASVKSIIAGNSTRAPVGKSGVVFRWFLNNGLMNVTYTQPTLKTLATVPASLNGSQLNSAYVLDTKSASKWVYFVIQNPFNVSHPMHLHGHDYSVLGEGPGFFTASMSNTLNFKNPTRRDTTLLYGTPLSVSGYTVIGFETDNPGAWVMHCHIIWHSDGGMAMQFIERPDAIDAETYWDKPAFQDQCSAMTSYEAEGPERKKLDYETGLRRRHHLGSHAHKRGAFMGWSGEDVVRRSF